MREVGARLVERRRSRSAAPSGCGPARRSAGTRTTSSGPSCAPPAARRVPRRRSPACAWTNRSQVGLRVARGLVVLSGCPNSGHASLRHSQPGSVSARSRLAGCPQVGQRGTVFAHGRSVAPCSSTTPRSRAIATRSGSSWRTSASRTSAIPSTSSTAPAAGAARRPQPGAARPDARARRRPPAGGVQRHPHVPRRRARPTSPRTRYARAQVLQWLFFEQYSHEPYIAVVRFWVAFAPEPPRGGGDRRAPPRRARGAEGHGAPPHGPRVPRRERATPSPTSGSTDTRTSRDEGGFDLERYPAILAWLERVRTQPGHVPMAA